jgi:transcriptional regulator with XRE-family HTH domain
MVVTVWSGRETRALRTALRKTIEAFAEHLGVAVRTVAKWEAQGPKIVPTAEIQEALDTALERATPAQQSRFQMLLEESSAPDERANRVNRREFINDVLAVVTLGMLHPERLAAAPGPPVAVDKRLLEDLEAMAHEYGRMYWFTSPAALWPAIYGHATMTRCIHDSAPAAIRREAAALASQSAALLGLLAHRLHKRSESVMYLSVAVELAVEAQNRSLHGHALVALRTVYSPVTANGRSADPQKALRLLDEAEDVAGPTAPSLLRTWLHACRAEDHAFLGHVGEAKRDSDVAESALAQAPHHPGGFFDHWDSTRLEGFRGNCAVLLREPEEAISILEAVVRNTSPDLVGPYAAVQADLAAAYSQHDEVERACALLDDVLVSAHTARMPEQAARVHRIRNAYLSHRADTAAVRQLDDHLSQFGIGA